MAESKQRPYRSFGEVLKKLRSRASKTPAEVSGAVEIDETRLQAYENGEQRPSEDILLLLIQHFNLKEEQASELWKLAGYHGAPDEALYLQEEFGPTNQQVETINVSIQDNRIVYTDMVQVMVNNYGVVMNFLQGAGPNNKPLAVSRVGMSKEHAKSIIEILQKTLEQSNIPPKQLKNPNNKKNKHTQ